MTGDHRSQPLVSFVVPIVGSHRDEIDATVGSVLEQLSDAWELLLVGDSGAAPSTTRDERIRLLSLSGGASRATASNAGIEAARGTFVAVLIPGDTLRNDAVIHVSTAVGGTPEADYLYTDEYVRVGEDTTVTEFTKPEWSPERLLGQPYAVRLAIMRRSLLDRIGGLDERFGTAASYDLALRATEQATRIVHVPHAVHRAAGGGRSISDANTGADWELGRLAVQDALERRGMLATAVLGSVPGTYGIHRDAGEALAVSVIVPTRGTTGAVFGAERLFVLEAVRSVLNAPTVHRLEIVIVYDLDTPQAVLDALRDLAPDAVRLVPFDGPFNFSRKCNVGFLASRGEVVVFLNDDTELITADAIDRLVSPLREPDVGMTGAKLRYEDGSLQHAGHRYNNNEFTHAFLGAPDDDRCFGALQVNREVSGLTAACVALRREVFEEVGGFFEGLPINFNDVDLSVKLRSVGYRLLWLAGVEFWHFESRSRAPEFARAEVDVLLGRWVGFDRDPYTPVI